MTPDELLAAFETVADAPDGVARLRELVLELAVRGKLVPQDPADEPASVRLRGRRFPTPLDRRPFPLPNGWAWSSISRLGQVLGGGTPSKVNPQFWDGAIPWVTPKDMKRDLIADAQDHISAAAVAGSAVKRIPSGALLMVVRGMILAHSFPTALTTAVVTVNQDMKALVPYDASLAAYLLLVTKGVKPAVLALVERSTHGTCKLPTNALFELPLPIAPWSEQRRIVARVDELMGLLDRLEAARTACDATRAAVRDSVLDALREADTTDEVETAWNRLVARIDDLVCDPADIPPLRQTVLELAVRGRLVRQDPADEPASVLLERIAAEKARTSTVQVSDDSPLPTTGTGLYVLPTGWQVSGLECLVAGTDAGWSPRCDAHPTTSSSEWGVLKTTAIQPNRYLAEHHKALPATLVPRPELEVAVGDVLVTRAGPSFRVGVAAHVAATRGRLLLSDKIIRCRLLPHGADGAWVALCINVGPGARFLREQQSGMDAAQMNISQARLRRTPVLVPPLHEQRRIVARVAELMGLLDRLEARLDAAQVAHVAFTAAAVHHLDA